MTDTALIAILSTGISAAAQAIKDHTKLNPASLRYSIGGLSLVTAILVSVAGGMPDKQSLLVNLAVGSLLPAGFHSVLLQDSFLGSILKAVGGAALKPPANPT